MAACRQCSSSLGENDRFCAACGLAAGGEADTSFRLLDSTDGPIVQGGAVERRPDRNRLYAFVAAGLFGLLLFALARSPGADPDDPQNAEILPETIEDESADEETPTTRRTTTSRRPTSSTTLERDISYIGDGGPLLEEETGLYLFVGGDSSSLKRVDLDTGEVIKYKQRYFPTFASGDYLVVSTDSGSSRVVLIDDPVSDSGVFLSSGYFYPGSGTVRQGPTEDQVWIVGADYEDPTWQLVRLRDGEVLDEVDVPGGTVYGPNIGGPDIAGAPSGGVFVRESGIWQRVAEGSVVATSDDYVLAETCESPVDCEMFWLDRGSWEVVERAIPDIRPQWAWLSPGGRVLAYYGASGPVMFDVERGTALTGIGQDIESMAVSPDGRFLATANGTVRIHNLDTDETFSLTGVSMSGWGSALFVEKP